MWSLVVLLFLCSFVNFWRSYQTEDYFSFLFIVCGWKIKICSFVPHVYFIGIIFVLRLLYRHFLRKILWSHFSLSNFQKTRTIKWRIPMSSQEPTADKHTEREDKHTDNDSDYMKNTLNKEPRDRNYRKKRTPWRSWTTMLLCLNVGVFPFLISVVVQWYLLVNALWMCARAVG